MSNTERPFDPNVDSLEINELIENVTENREEKVKTFRSELEQLLNRNSMENGCNTPDFILATFLTNCLISFDTAVKHREKWNSSQGVTEEEHIDFSKLLETKDDEDE